MTMGDYLTLVSRELGWSEERITAHKKRANNLLPHMEFKTVVFPCMGCKTEHEFINFMKKFLSGVDALPPESKNVLFDEVSATIRARTQSN